MTPPELRALLADTIAVWGIVDAQATLDGGGVVVSLPDGAALRVRAAAGAERPVRWWLERDGRRRPCLGTIGLLRALRNALGAGEGAPQRLRIAAADAG
jgi:hypothetical protein